MHETGIAVEILHGALRAMQEKNGGRATQLLSVKVAIGELSSINPEALRQAWRAVVSESPHEKAQLEVKWCPVYRKCPSCDTVLANECGLLDCPDCHGPLAVEGGKELELESLEFDQVRNTQPQ